MSFELLACVKFRVIGTTYSFGDGHIVLESSDDRNILTLDTNIDNLASGDIGVGSVVEKSGRESWCLGNTRRVEHANEDMVVEQSLDETLL